MGRKLEITIPIYSTWMSGINPHPNEGAVVNTDWDADCEGTAAVASDASRRVLW